MTPAPIEKPALEEEPRRLRVSLLGPTTPPFRGGIAQYTTELKRALQDRCELRTVSFRRQYPAWLYPGTSDREPGMEYQRESDVQYRLDALNPLTWLGASREIAAAGCDLALINWWTLFWAPGFALIAHRLRACGVPVVFICHNLADHDSGVVRRRISDRLLAQADGYLAHSSEMGEKLRRQFPRKPVRVHPLPAFGSYPAASNPPPKRGRLELLFFGFIRPYKGLDVLVNALASLDDREVFLTVVGEPWCAPETLRKLVAVSGAPNVELHLECVDARSAANFFARADIIVLPYRSATGSAVVALAYHYGKPVLATCVGGFPDVVENGRTGFLVDADSPRQIADCLRGVRREALQAMTVAIGENRRLFTWTSLADVLLGMANELRHE